jgi:hypothetical protein
MFFKKKIDIEDYCTMNLKSLFSTEREIVYEKLRQACADPALSAADKKLYFDHIRAAVIQLLHVAILKNSNSDISFDGHMSVMMFLNQRGLSHIETLGGIYNRAFGGHPQDGIAGIVEAFSGHVAKPEMRADTAEHFYGEFSQMSKAFNDDFKSIKLTTKRK